MSNIEQFIENVEDVAAPVGKLLGAISEKPNYRTGSGITNRDRQIMTWRLPNGNTVQMYINPQSFVVNESKQINATRTKGGFVVQYWGDNLIDISIQGTTGSSGVKGIQVLRDIYRSENRAFELVASTQANYLAGVENELNIGDASELVSNLSQVVRERNFILRPSLASFALSVSLFYQGIQYKGYFESFSMTENTNNLGLFDYNISFKATEAYGVRDNFMAWHKEPLADSPASAALGGVLNSAGNAVRSWVGLPEQAQTPTQFHPESAPLSFGGSVLGSDPLATAIDMF